MKSVKMVLGASLLLLCVLSFPGAASAQGVLSKRANTPIPGANSNGFLEWLPVGYETGAQRYPLIVYINGIGSTGDGSEGVQGVGGGLENHFTGGGYPHEQQREGSWRDETFVGGNPANPSYRFVIITPQFLTPMHIKFPTPEEVNNVINYAIANYRIDTSRIYIVGQSQGGGAVWNYPGESSAYAKRVAAIVPFSGVSYPIESKANIIKYNNVAVWAFHNFYDAAVPSYFTNDYVDFINAAPAPTIPAKKSITVAFNSDGSPNTAHPTWYPWLRRDTTENGLDIYEWMLQYQRQISAANAGDFREITLPTNSLQLNGSGTGPNGTTTSTNWQKMSGPTGGDISNPAVSNPTLSNLTAGKYIYRYTTTDNSGATAFSDVTIVVNPVTVRYQAEDYTNMFGVQTEASQDEGGGLHVGFIDQGDFMEYSINVPTAGTYKVRFRFGSFVTGGMFRILNAGGTALDTVEVFDTGGWQNFLTKTIFLPLAAGTQTIRIESIASAGWNFNWFEIEGQSAAIILPVNFVLFNSSCVNGSTNLLWKTTGNVNTKNFAVERSADGSLWKTINTTAPAASTPGEQTYTYTDLGMSGGSYYRVVEYANDGRKTVSSILKTDCNAKSNFTVYPNPVQDIATVNISLAKRSRLSISVIDSRGAVVRQLESMLPEGRNQVSVNMSGLPKGVYTLRALYEGEKKNIQLIKK